MGASLAPSGGRLPKKVVLFVCFRQKPPKRLIRIPICRFAIFFGAFLLLWNILYMQTEGLLLLLWDILFYILVKYQPDVVPQAVLGSPQKTALNPSPPVIPKPSLLKAPQCLLAQSVATLLCL